MKKTRRNANTVAVAFILLIALTIWLTISYVNMKLPLPQMAGTFFAGVLTYYLLRSYASAIDKKNGE